MIRSCLSSVVRPLRYISHRLTGFHELRERLDRQQVMLEVLQNTVLEQGARQQELLRALTARDQREPPSADRGDAPAGEIAALRRTVEGLGAQQTQLRSAVIESIKASEKAVLEELVHEIDRLDGYLVFHANELRAAIGRIEARFEAGRLRRDSEPPRSEAA